MFLLLWVRVQVVELLKSLEVAVILIVEIVAVEH